MSKKVEEYIESYMRKGSNVIDPNAGYGRSCAPWLTPDNARAVAKIAREEVIEQTIKWLTSSQKGFILTEKDIDDYCKFINEE